MPKLSVIIPYYNENKKIFNKCIDSVLKQSFDDYELIIVDDGSKEDNAAYLEKFSEKDKRISVFHQVNQGVSVARNNGVKKASGKYITFVDADDVCLPYFFEEALFYAESNKADILYSFIYKSTDENFIPSENDNPKIEFLNEDWIKKYTVGYLKADGRKRFGRGPFARIIKAKIVKSVEFPPGIPIGEDVIWNLKIAHVAQRKILVDKIWYLYMFRDSSVTNKYDTNIIEKLRPFYSEINKYLNKKDKDYYYNRVFRDLSRYVFSCYLGNRQNKDSLLKKWHKFNEICRIEPWRAIREKNFFKLSRFKNKIKIFLAIINVIYPVWRLRDFVKGKEI